MPSIPTGPLLSKCAQSSASRAAAATPGPAALGGFTFHCTEGHVSVPRRDLKPDSLAKFGKKRSLLRAQEPSCPLELFPQGVKLDKSSAQVEHTHTHHRSRQNPSEHNSSHLQGLLLGKVKHAHPEHLFKKKLKVGNTQMCFRTLMCFETEFIPSKAFYTANTTVCTVAHGSQCTPLSPKMAPRNKTTISLQQYFK